MLVPEDGTLHIDRITVEDEGLYTCEASNERGSVESSAYVSVESKKDVVLFCYFFFLPFPVKVLTFAIQ